MCAVQLSVCVCLKFHMIYEKNAQKYYHFFLDRRKEESKPNISNEKIIYLLSI